MYTVNQWITVDCHFIQRQNVVNILLNVTCSFQGTTPHMRDVSWQIDVIFPAEHVQCVFYVVDFLQPTGSPYFQEDRPVGDGTFGQKEWTLELISDDDTSDLKLVRCSSSCCSSMKSRDARSNIP